MPAKRTRFQLETLLGQVIIDNNAGEIDPADMRQVLLAHFASALLEEDGVALLDADGRLPANLLPTVVALLGNDGRLPANLLPAVVALLEADGRLPVALLPNPLPFTATAWPQLIGLPGANRDLLRLLRRLDAWAPPFQHEDYDYDPGDTFSYTMPGEAGPSVFVVLNPVRQQFNPLPEAPPADPAAPPYYRLTPRPAADTTVVSNVMPAAWAAKTPGLLWQLPFVGAVCTVDEEGRRYVRGHCGTTVLYEPGEFGAPSFLYATGGVNVTMQNFGWPPYIVAAIMNKVKDAMADMVSGISNANYRLPTDWPPLVEGRRLISAKRLVVDFIKAACGVFVPGAVVPFEADCLGNVGQIEQESPAAFAAGGPGEYPGAYHNRTHLTAVLAALAELVATELAEGDNSPVTDFAERYYGVDRSQFVSAAAELLDRIASSVQ